jgi:hypothetical protein
MMSYDIEQIIMGSVAQRDREFEAYEVTSETLPLQGGAQGSQRGWLASQAYRSVALFGKTRS